MVYIYIFAKDIWVVLNIWFFSEFFQCTEDDYDIQAVGYCHICCLKFTYQGPLSVSFKNSSITCFFLRANAVLFLNRYIDYLGVCLKI